MEERDIYKAIEEACKTQQERYITSLLNVSDEMTDAKLHELRGKSIAAKDLLRHLRNALGYNVDELH